MLRNQSCVLETMPRPASFLVPFRSVPPSTLPTFSAAAAAPHRATQSCFCCRPTVRPWRRGATRRRRRRRFMLFALSSTSFLSKGGALPGRVPRRLVSVFIVGLSYGAREYPILNCTVIGARMWHMKWRETKEQLICWPDLALLGCYFVSLHFQCDILAPITVDIGCKICIRSMSCPASMSQMFYFCRHK